MDIFICLRPFGVYGEEAMGATGLTQLAEAAQEEGMASQEGA